MVAGSSRIRSPVVRRPCDLSPARAYHSPRMPRRSTAPALWTLPPVLDAPRRSTCRTTSSATLPARATRRSDGADHCKFTFSRCAQAGIARRMPTAPQRGILRRGRSSVMDTTRRGNYDSGEDFVLEYGELRFTFNERDFMERCEQAALKLGFVSGRLDGAELEDLVNLAVNGEINEPASALGEHVNDCWPELVGPSDRSLVHWLRRLVFRSAWLDQRVKEGELDVAYDAGSQTFTYVQPDRGGQPVELAPEPSWGRVAYVPR